MFTAHQDVVPVQSLGGWTYPPFQPYFDGSFLWGRGTCDCKNNLIGTLSAVEELLAADAWQPRRTIILAYGFDEECNGYKGAAHIAEVLERKWGKDGIALIIDEGGMGLENKSDVIYALPAVHEKSAVEIYIDLQIAGGHASKPPHSGIGVMSEIVVALEAHPYQPVLLAGSPYYNHLVCQACYSPSSDPWLGDALANGQLDYVAERIATQSPEIRFRLQTSQAVDMIHGGAKINALPETVSIGIDYRIAQHDSIADIRAIITKYVRPIAEKYGLSLSGFDEDGDAAASATTRELFVNNGTLRLRQGESSLTTPIAPTEDSAIWDEFSATVQHVFSSYAKTVVPVGDFMNGNTDTRHYWNLTGNIYRWSPSRLGTRLNVHATDERLDMSAHIDGFRLYYGEAARRDKNTPMYVANDEPLQI
jgi:Gly-Xaa carboxypeptidase